RPAVFLGWRPVDVTPQVDTSRSRSFPGWDSVWWPIVTTPGRLSTLTPSRPDPVAVHRFAIRGSGGARESDPARGQAGHRIGQPVGNGDLPGTVVIDLY